jgi:Tol biopolymer transport system component
MMPTLGWVVTITVLVLTTKAIPAPGGPRVEEKFGNIIYDQANGTERQITNLHMDGQPTLSPDGKTIAFIRIEGQATMKGDPDITALWVADGPSGNIKRLLGSHARRSV